MGRIAQLKNVTDYFIVSALLDANKAEISDEPELVWPGGDKELAETIHRLTDAGFGICESGGDGAD